MGSPARSFLRQLARGLRQRCRVSAGSRVLVATSGGADSVALLRGLVDLSGRRGWSMTLAVGHVQHHQRPPELAEADAQFVADLAAQLDLPFLRADLDRNTASSGGNVEAALRRGRYAALVTMARTFDASFIAVAHQADDQLETLLMRLLRGASVRGLAAMPWRRPLRPQLPRAGVTSESSSAPESTITLIRPMLAIPRRDILAYLREIHQPWREDHTNADVTRLRARLRRDVLPVLHEITADLPQRTVQLADHLRALSHLLDANVALAADRVRIQNGSAELDRAEARRLAPVVLAGLFRRLLVDAGVPADALSHQTLGSITRAVRDTRGGTRTFDLAAGVRVSITRQTVSIHRTP